MLDKFTLLNIRKIVKYAEDHPVDFKTLLEMKNFGKPGYSGPIPAGINLNNTFKLFDKNHQHFYNAAISIEQMERVWVRHFSVSVSTGDVPDSSVIIELLPLFGFMSNDFKKLYVVYEKGVMHIMEPLDWIWKSFCG